MKVHIEGNLYLESDGMQFIIKEYTGKTSVDAKGNVTEHYKTHGFFSNIKSAMKKLVKMKLMQSTATTLQELMEDVKRIEKYIESKINV